MGARPMKPPYRVLVVDDHKFVCEMIAHKLSVDRSIEIVGIATHGATAVEIARSRDVDIALLDMALEQEDGLGVARQLLAARPQLRIIGLSMHDHSHYPIALLELGGMGFLTKRTSAREIGEAVRRVAGGGMAVSPEIAVFLATHTYGNPVERIRQLTVKEIEVLGRVASGLPVKDIAQVLGLTEKTVQGHRNNLRKKLGARTDVELCLLALKAGIVDLHRLQVPGV
ncbi:MAG TPA: response regulator transcription factor [Gammaproteobacteria bacterium]|nr:response regulator transcription factor [Gammaproteobacteria bacterium]